jgi:hypothetical protein
MIALIYKWDRAFDDVVPGGLLLARPRKDGLTDSTSDDTAAG